MTVQNHARAFSRRSVSLVADVGGTNARFATVGAEPHDLHRIEVLPCGDFPHIGDAIDAYLKGHDIEDLLEVCIAVAGPVDHEWIDLPNNHWAFSRNGLQASLGVPLTILNDFTAQAMCIDALLDTDLVWFGKPRAVDPGIRTVLGPGTGLGVAVQMLDGEIIPSEGGHVGFAPFNEHEIEILSALLGRYRRVSVERLLSGPGLENIFWANRQLTRSDARPEPEHLSAKEIARLAAQGDALARRTVDDFFDILATFAGDVALFTWSTGGVYLSGGVFRKLSSLLDVERFRARFEDKGRFTRFCETVPLAWITHEYPGLLGCAVGLRADSSPNGTRLAEASTGPATGMTPLG